MTIFLIILGIGLLAGISLAIYFKFFSPDDFSIWTNKWFGKDQDKDQSYMDKF